MVQKKRTWHLWTISCFMIFLYAMGIYDFFMMLFHNRAYYLSHGYNEAVMEYFTNYPLYFMFFWISNLVCGLLAPVLLIFRKRQASTIALISVISDLILMIGTSLFRNRIDILGEKVFQFDIFILFTTFGFYIYSIKQLQRLGQTGFNRA